MPALIGSRRALFYNTPAVVAASAPTASFVGADYLSGATSDITVTGNIGTQAANRVVVAIAYNGNDAYSDVMCGGVPMSVLLSTTNNATVCKMWVLAGASGGSGSQSIVATATGAYHQRALAVYTIENLASTTAVATDTVYANPSNLDFTSAAGDIIIAGGYTTSAGNWNSSTEAPNGTPTASALGGGTDLYTAFWNDISTAGAFTANYSITFLDGFAVQYR